jgi:hypothetical protein
MVKRIRKLYTFPIDAELAAGLKAVKERRGISEADQVRRGIRLWLKSQGELKAEEKPGKATTRAKS